MWEVRKIQNQDIIMRKVGKWFIIIGIAGVLSILFVEWSRWNIISLSKKLHSIILNENSYVFKANFIEGIIGTVSIFSLLAAPFFIKWDRSSAINIASLIAIIFIDVSAFITAVARGEIFGFYIIVIFLPACFYMKIIIIEVLQRIYHWIRIETKTNQYDVEKIMLILTIMTFIFVMGCLV